MEETKKCPYCGEEILATAKKCKHCGEWLEQEVTAPVASQVSNKVGANQASDTLETKRWGFFEYYFENVWNSNESSSLIPSFDFSGTMPRKQFWISSILISFTYGAIFTLLLLALPISGMVRTIIVIAFYLFFFIKMIELQVRRLHDIGKNGWLVVLMFVPIVNIVNLVFYCKKGSDSAKTQWGKKDTFSLIALFVAIIALRFVASTLASI